MMTVYLFGVGLAVFVSCPDWPWYNNHPEVFLPVKSTSEKESVESKDLKKKVNKK